MKLKKAMKLYPIKVNNDLGSPVYELGSRSIKSQALSPGKWMQARTQNATEYTEKEAVAWLIEGAEKKQAPFSMVSMLSGSSVISTCWSKCPICGVWHKCLHTAGR